MTAKTLGRPLLVARSLHKSYSHGPWWRSGQRHRALDGVDLIIRIGQTLAVVGESGSGKTTLATCLAALERPDSGEIWFEEVDLVALPSRKLRALRPRFQLIQQDSAAALNPRLTAEQIVGEPLRVQGCGGKRAQELCADLLSKVGLSPDSMTRRPHQFSGGQRQRLAIARALTLKPSLLILDEPFTGLDLSIRGQIANLLLDLQHDFGFAYLYVSHEFESVRRFADEVAVMDKGRIVEQASAEQLFENPAHPRTRGLLAAMPQIDLRFARLRREAIECATS